MIEANLQCSIGGLPEESRSYPEGGRKGGRVTEVFIDCTPLTCVTVYTVHTTTEVGHPFQ